MAKQLTKEEQEMADSFEESLEQAQNQNTSLVSPNSSGGVAIKGMEDIPMSIIAIPLLRLIQPTSQKTEDAQGKEILPGNFLFNDTQKAYGEIDCVLLRSKVAPITFTRPEGDVTVNRLSILGLQLPENKMFILSLSPTSFSNFGRLVAQLKDAKIQESYRFLVSITAEKKENDKGKFYIAKFQLGEELNPETLLYVQKLAQDYGGTLDRQSDQE